MILGGDNAADDRRGADAGSGSGRTCIAAEMMR
jgi:hypothetical protein